MAKVSVSEAARLAGISRTNFYKSYVKTGKITVERADDGKPTVDTSEILRVFGRLQDDSNDSEQKEQKITHENIPNVSAAIEAEMKAVRDLLNVKEEQLSEAKDREIWMRKQLEELTTAIKLIEDKREQQPIKKKRWWQF